MTNKSCFGFIASLAVLVAAAAAQSVLFKPQHKASDNFVSGQDGFDCECVSTETIEQQCDSDSDEIRPDDEVKHDRPVSGKHEQHKEGNKLPQTNVKRPKPPGKSHFAISPLSLPGCGRRLNRRERHETRSGHFHGEAIVGAHNLDYSGNERVPILHYVPNRKYNRKTTKNDIALVVLARPLTMDHAKQAVCLPASGQAVKPGKMCVTLGWGAVSADKQGNLILPSRLQQGKVPILSRKQCNTKKHYGGDVLSGMFCAGNGTSDACMGDSGGPLVCKFGKQWVLTGVTSWGQNCGDKRYPSVYTKVSQFENWIHEQLAHLGKL